MGYRNTGGKIEGTMDGRRYEKDKFWYGTEGQVGLIKDNVKERILGAWSPRFGKTRRAVRASLEEILQKGEVEIEAFFGPLISEAYRKHLKSKNKYKKHIEKEMERMSKGYAPYANYSQTLNYGSKADVKQQIHHTCMVREGKNVHNLDCLVLSSPAYHEQCFLTPVAHYGPHYGRIVEERLKERAERYRKQILTK